MRITRHAVAQAFLLGVLLVLTGLMRLWNHADVFVSGHTFFIDADCYSRMTRVQQVVEHPGIVIHRHEFENWPNGTQPHTTAPFDYLTAGLAMVLRPLAPNSESSINLAGALVSPLLGVITAAFLWFWAGRLGLIYRVPMIVLFATSPILVHGTVLGRPDHQSLLILCMAVALGADTVLRIKPSMNWALTGGLAWGLGLWVSLYEPAVLLLATTVLNFGVRIADRGKKRDKESTGIVSPSFRIPLSAFRFLACVAVLLLAAIIDGWQSPVPNPEVLKYFPNWSRTIGELGHATLPVLLRWSGALLLLSPMLLLPALLRWRNVGKSEVRSGGWFWFALLVLTSALTCWQLRWGYFFALIFVMGLPWQLGIVEALWARRKESGSKGIAPASTLPSPAIRAGSPVAIILFALALWPVGREWMACLIPNEPEMVRRIEQRQDSIALFDVAQHLRSKHRLPILAPWWQSPALAYWSGQPCVAGSSHESLPGTVDSARFYLCDDPATALSILEKRRVACVLAYEPERVIATSSALLGTGDRNQTDALELGGDPAKPMGVLLFRQPHRPPQFLKLVYLNTAFRVFLRTGGVNPD